MINNEDTYLLNQLNKTNPEIFALVNRINQERNNTVAKVSHDIKNIITTLSSSFQFIESQHPEATSFNLWPQLKISITYLIEFMEQESLYRHSSSVEKAQMDVKNLLWSLPDLMDELYEDSPHICIRDFNYNISKELPDICGDYEKLKIAFLAILKNAFEATSSNDSITISAYPLNNSIAISIKDNGVGIDQSIIKDVTTPFFTTKQSHAGTGLSIAKQVASAHGGSLSISSEEDTCITITLPLT